METIHNIIKLVRKSHLKIVTLNLYDIAAYWKSTAEFQCVEIVTYTQTAWWNTTILLDEPTFI